MPQQRWLQGMWSWCRLAAAVAEKKLQTPHGRKLVNLLLPEDQHQAANDACTKTIELSDRNACDVELLTVGWAPPGFQGDERMAASEGHAADKQGADREPHVPAGGSRRWKAS